MVYFPAAEQHSGEALTFFDEDTKSHLKPEVIEPSAGVDRAVLAILSDAYDMVCNGYEMASGSIRIHRRDIQSKVFNLLGISDEEAQYKFGHMLEAFEYGAPPHGGMAPASTVWSCCGRTNRTSAR